MCSWLCLSPEVTVRCVRGCVYSPEAVSGQRGLLAAALGLGRRVNLLQSLLVGGEWISTVLAPKRPQTVI